MVKKFPYYVLHELFTFNLSNWQAMNCEEIISDTYKLLKKHNLHDEMILNGDYEFQEEDDLIDLELYLDSDFRGFYGNLYVTWRKDNGWPCSHIWFYGYNEDDTDQLHIDWENK